MSFLLILISLIVLAMVWPMLRGMFYLNSLRRRVEDAFGQQGHRGAAAEDREDDRKIYGSADGEYAEYEDVAGTVFTQTSVTDDGRAVVEQQVVDAEFEDIRE